MAQNDIADGFSDLELTFTFDYAVARPSVVYDVGNARAPYSGGCNFPQYF